MRPGRYGPYIDDPLADEDGWTEVVDADLSAANGGRVDLVGSPANGHGGFLIVKSGDSLLSPSQIRDLIAGSTPTPQKAVSSMSDSDILKASVDAKLRKAFAKRPLRKAAKKPSLVAVYDSTGKLVGTCDPAKITVLQSAEDPNAAKAPAPKAKEPSTAPEANPAPQIPEDATDGPAAGRTPPVPQAAVDASQEVKKALQGAGFRDGARPFAADGRSVSDRYASLIKSVDRGTQSTLGDAVANAALRFQYSSGISGQEAVRLAKSIALDLAAVEVRRPKPSLEAATAAMKRARPLR
jgi:hypothetical protein